MASERKFIKENTKRSLIKKFLLEEIEGAGFGGMSIQRTPIGTRINILVERPGMVIGKGGSKIKELTENIQNKFNVDNPQIEIQEAGASAPLNAQIMAEKLAEALERGWHFRRAGHSTVRRIMNAGAKGCQIIIAGKLTGSRHRTEKFTEGHVKYCGDIVKEIMDEGFATAKLKAGVLGVKVRIMKPDAKLPDEIKLKTREKEEVKIEEKKTEEKPEPKPKEKTDIKKLAEIQGIGPSVIKKLEKAKITSLEELYEMDIDSVMSIEGIGKKTAETIIKKLEKLIEEGN
ncbi:MAG: 30S ribosomal protein S3 [Thermoplasmatales archaeon]|nr:30S ribosomal protein S3 [Thermoplasmatales archaeon]